MSKYPYTGHDEGIVVTNDGRGKFLERPMTSAELAARDAALSIASDIYKHANSAGICYIHIWEEIAKAAQAAIDEALRRPVQSDEVEAIRADLTRGYRNCYALPDQAAELAIGKLLSVLDQAQREIHDLRCPPDADGDQHACKVCGFPIRYGERHGKCGRFVMALEAEIDRLSSPPQERTEIRDRNEARKEDPDGWDLVNRSRFAAVSDIDTLLGDCAAWRNARAVVTADRDELKAAKLAHDSEQRAAALALHDERIERLEGALRSISTRIGGGAYSHDGMEDLLIWAGKEASGALAAADGQQPYIVQGFWSPCRKYIASVQISNGRLVAVQDDNGDVWEPTGPAQDMAKVTP